MSRAISEKEIQNNALVAVSSLPRTLVFRNNTGMAWQGIRVKAAIGQTVVVKPGMIILNSARPVSFGLNGSGDIMGVSDGLPIAIEIKTVTGRQSQDQKNFERAWELAGGKYILGRSTDEILQKLTLSEFM